MEERESELLRVSGGCEPGPMLSRLELFDVLEPVDRRFIVAEVSMDGRPQPEDEVLIPCKAISARSRSRSRISSSSSSVEGCRTGAVAAAAEGSRRRGLNPVGW